MKFLYTYMLYKTYNWIFHIPYMLYITNNWILRSKISVYCGPITEVCQSTIASYSNASVDTLVLTENVSWNSKIFIKLYFCIHRNNYSSIGPGGKKITVLDLYRFFPFLSTYTVQYKICCKQDTTSDSLKLKRTAVFRLFLV